MYPQLMLFCVMDLRLIHILYQFVILLLQQFIYKNIYLYTPYLLTLPLPMN